MSGAELPDMPSGGRDRFLREMEKAGVPVSRETLSRLDVFVDNLVRWQKAINLVGRNTLQDVWERHVLDSAQIKPLVPAEATTIADLGSGGGFPGLVLAALCPEIHVTLIEADARKAAFLGDTARRMALPRSPRLRIGRIEAAEPAGADIVTARALAPLGQLLAWASRHGKTGAICLFHKGKGWQGELTEATKAWDITCQPIISVTDRDAVILRIGSLSPTPDLCHREPERRRREDNDGH
ncbi:MAG: 16S rRNA (guanine(527)-N(7))-methyltransferase RsmG [Pseudomonadota bacterium]